MKPPETKPTPCPDQGREPRFLRPPEWDLPPESPHRWQVQRDLDPWGAFLVRPPYQARQAQERVLLQVPLLDRQAPRRMDQWRPGKVRYRCPWPQAQWQPRQDPAARLEALRRLYPCREPQAASQAPQENWEWIQRPSATQREAFSRSLASMLRTSELEATADRLPFYMT